METTVHILVSYLRVDISKLEKRQSGATKILSKLKNMSYENRIKTLCLTNLEEIRKRWYLIYVYKLTKSHESINWENNHIQI